MRLLVVYGQAEGGMARVVDWLVRQRRALGWQQQVVRLEHWRQWPMLGRLIATQRPQLIEAHGWRALWCLRWLRDRVRPASPLVALIHAYPPERGWRRGFWAGAERLVPGAADLTVAVSPSLEAWLRSNARAAKCGTIVSTMLLPLERPLPRDEARKKLGIAPDAFVVGSVGRLIAVKGYDVLLRAWAQLQPLLNDASPTGASQAWRLMIIGDGPARESLQRSAQQFGIAENVRFYGAVDRAGICLSAFDVYVQPSRREGAGLAVIEAMHAGVPVIATRTGLFEAGALPRRVLTVAPGAEQELTAALSRLCRWSPSLRQRYGRRLQQACASFVDPQAGLARLQQWYQALVSS